MIKVLEKGMIVFLAGQDMYGPQLGDDGEEQDVVECVIADMYFHNGDDKLESLDLRKVRKSKRELLCVVVKYVEKQKDRILDYTIVGYEDLFATREEALNVLNDQLVHLMEVANDNLIALQKKYGR